MSLTLKRDEVANQPVLPTVDSGLATYFLVGRRACPHLTNPLAGVPMQHHALVWSGPASAYALLSLITPLCWAEGTARQLYRLTVAPPPASTQDPKWASLCIPFYLCCYCHSSSSVTTSFTVNCMHQPSSTLGSGPAFAYTLPTSQSMLVHFAPLPQVD